MLKCNKYFTGVAITLLVLLSCNHPQQTLSCTNGFLIKVPAKPDDWRIDIFTPTNLNIEKGYTLKFSAVGIWNMGLASTGPDGRNKSCGCPISEVTDQGVEGPLGALIGRIGKDGTPFLIGSQKTMYSNEYGILYLTSNDNMEACNKFEINSCYRDNYGTMDVCIELQK